MMRLNPQSPAQAASRKGWSLRLRLFLFVLSSALLAGCGLARVMAYRHADSLLSMQVDDYFDLSSRQDGFIERELSLLRDWHRSKELPAWRAPLQTLIVSAQERGLVAEDLKAVHEFAMRSLERTFERARPAAARFLAGLSEAQIAEMEGEMAKKNKKRYLALERESGKYREEALDKMSSRLEPWIGRLTKEQKTYLDGEAGAQRALDLQLRDDSLARQRAFAELLRKHRKDPDFEAQLAVWTKGLVWRDQPNSKEPRQVSLSRTFTRLDALLKLLTDEQRRRLLQELKSLRSDLDAMLAG